ncbi:hypothetical protein F2P79_007241 [Pimephales promelas]|nr:hypothetical protein F2P79_007241 [Pimephales promelas]
MKGHARALDETRVRWLRRNCLGLSYEQRWVNEINRSRCYSPLCSEWVDTVTPSAGVPFPEDTNAPRRDRPHPSSRTPFKRLGLDLGELPTRL